MEALTTELSQLELCNELWVKIELDYGEKLEQIGLDVTSKKRLEELWPEKGPGYLKLYLKIIRKFRKEFTFRASVRLRHFATLLEEFEEEQEDLSFMVNWFWNCRDLLSVLRHAFEDDVFMDIYGTKEDVKEMKESLNIGIPCRKGKRKGKKKPETPVVNPISDPYLLVGYYLPTDGCIGKASKLSVYDPVLNDKGMIFLPIWLSEEYAEFHCNSFETMPLPELRQLFHAFTLDLLKQPVLEDAVVMQYSKLFLHMLYLLDDKLNFGDMGWVLNLLECLENGNVFMDKSVVDNLGDYLLEIVTKSLFMRQPLSHNRALVQPLFEETLFRQHYWIGRNGKQLRYYVYSKENLTTIFHYSHIAWKMEAFYLGIHSIFVRYHSGSLFNWFNLPTSHALDRMSWLIKMVWGLKDFNDLFQLLETYTTNPDVPKPEYLLWLQLGMANANKRLPKPAAVLV